MKTGLDLGAQAVLARSLWFALRVPTSLRRREVDQCLTLLAAPNI